jgi:hypothetical protein
MRRKRSEGESAPMTLGQAVAAADYSYTLAHAKLVAGGF